MKNKLINCLCKDLNINDLKYLFTRFYNINHITLDIMNLCNDEILRNYILKTVINDIRYNMYSNDLEELNNFLKDELHYEL